MVKSVKVIHKKRTGKSAIQHIIAYDQTNRNKKGVILSFFPKTVFSKSDLVINTLLTFYLLVQRFIKF